MLVVIVSKPDLVENRVVRLEETFTQEELDQAANFLNGEFHGWSLGTIRLEVFHRMEADKILCDRLLKNVATLFMWGALSEEETGGLIVDGTAKILERPEFADVQKIKQLVKTLEEKAKLARDPGSLPANAGSGRAHPDRAGEFRAADAPLHAGGGAAALPRPRGGGSGRGGTHAYGVRSRHEHRRVCGPYMQSNYSALIDAVRRRVYRCAISSEGMESMDKERDETMTTQPGEAGETESAPARRDRRRQGPPRLRRDWRRLTKKS